MCNITKFLLQTRVLMFNHMLHWFYFGTCYLHSLCDQFLRNQQRKLLKPTLLQTPPTSRPPPLAKISTTNWSWTVPFLLVADIKFSCSPLQNTKKKNLGKFFRSSACTPLLTRLYFWFYWPCSTEHLPFLKFRRDKSATEYLTLLELQKE
jgi:hypothetical protein